MEKKEMYVYKIKHNILQTYSIGTTHPRFTRQGKIWSQKTLRQHLSQFNRKSIIFYYKDCSIIKYQLVEKDSEDVLITQFGILV